MTQQGNTFRYYYWLIREFGKKHNKMIFLSFFLSLLFILSLLSFSSQLDALFLTDTRVVGMVGSYEPLSLPSEILNNISYGLVYIDNQGVVKPAVAQRWEGSADGKKFNIYLKKNLIWDDNKSLTAEDLEFNFQDVEVKKIDDFQIEFNLKRPLTIFPTYLTKPLIRYPLHGVVGNYKVKKMKLGQENNVIELVLTPNKKDLKPLTYRFYDSETKMINAYKLGNITEMKIYRKSVADGFKSWKNTKVEREIDYSTVLTLFFNESRQSLADKDFRKSISIAIPRPTLSAFGELAEGPISPTSWAYNTQLKKSLYDPVEARKQLKPATASVSAELTIRSYFDYEDQANIIENALKDAGLNASIVYGTPDNQNDFDMFLAFWKIPTDPDQYFFWHSTQAGRGNIVNIKNVRIDKLLEDGRKYIEPANRKKEYLDFQKILVDELPAAFLYYPYSYTVTRK